MARKADGVVLVVDAEQTRKQATKRTRDRIVEHGGKVLGVILNKRKYPIPAFLYKFL
jgi:Mrp family chromosome partitioning ATPase